MIQYDIDAAMMFYHYLIYYDINTAKLYI
jgi:hypothetical protein